MVKGHCRFFRIIYSNIFDVLKVFDFCGIFSFPDYLPQLSTRSWSWKHLVPNVLGVNLWGSTTPCFMRPHYIFTGIKHSPGGSINAIIRFLSKSATDWSFAICPFSFQNWWLLKLILNLKRKDYKKFLSFRLCLPKISYRFTKRGISHLFGL